MGLILDLAVLAIAAVVVGSLALLSWTFAISSARSVRRGRLEIAAARSAVADAEARILRVAEQARAARQDDGAADLGADEDGEHTDR